MSQNTVRNLDFIFGLTHLTGNALLWANGRFSQNVYDEIGGALFVIANLAMLLYPGRVKTVYFLGAIGAVGAVFFSIGAFEKEHVLFPLLFGLFTIARCLLLLQSQQPHENSRFWNFLRQNRKEVFGGIAIATRIMLMLSGFFNIELWAMLAAACLLTGDVAMILSGRKSKQTQN